MNENVFASNGPFLAFLVTGEQDVIINRITSSVSRRKVTVTSVFYHESTRDVAERLALLFNVTAHHDKFIPKGQVWLSLR